MHITIRLFAILKDRAGSGELSLDVPPSSTVSIASAEIATRLPAIADLLPKIAFAVNREYAKPDTILHEGDELALIPPVSGG
jgi:molybdopterin converting factor subunit 1